MFGGFVMKHKKRAWLSSEYEISTISNQEAVLAYQTLVSKYQRLKMIRKRKRESLPNAYLLMTPGLPVQ